MLATGRVDSHRYVWIDEKAQQEQHASDLFCHLRDEALWRELWSSITGRVGRLLALASVEAYCAVVDSRYDGARTVPINRIRGSSSSRCCDFDADFRPLQSCDQARWLRLAAARLRGATLPPVELIEVEGFYFVVDGHHRISVARALGEREIQATVTTWQVAGPLPWKKQSQRTQ
jgi:hypothetical protein